MAIDPATAKLIAKVALNTLTDEDKRRNLIIGIVVAIVIFIMIILIPLFILLSPIEAIKLYFSADENGNIQDSSYTSMVDIKNNYESKELKAGDFFRDFTGPLGNASELVEEDIEELKKKKILFVGGGVGAAPVYPQVKWLHEHGVDADVIIGSKTKDMLILEKEMEAVSGNYYPCTDDGSYGHAGMVTTMVE